MKWTLVGTAIISNALFALYSSDSEATVETVMNEAIAYDCALIFPTSVLVLPVGDEPPANELEKWS